VLALAPLALARRRDPGRDVDYPDRRVGLVDVLAALPARPEGVDPEILLVDLDLDRVVDYRVDEYAREGGVAPGLRVEGRDPHQAMNSLLRLQIAVGVLAPDLQGRALDPGLLAGLQVHQLDFEAGILGPT